MRKKSPIYIISTTEIFTVTDKIFETNSLCYSRLYLKLTKYIASELPSPSITVYVIVMALRCSR